MDGILDVLNFRFRVRISVISETFQKKAMVARKSLVLSNRGILIGSIPSRPLRGAKLNSL